MNMRSEKVVVNRKDLRLIKHNVAWLQKTPQKLTLINFGCVYLNHNASYLVIGILQQDTQ